MTNTMEERLQTFVTEYGRKNIENGILVEEGRRYFEQMLTDAGYERVVEQPVVYARSAPAGIDVVLERNITTLEDGVSYLQLEGLTQLDDFKQKYDAVIASGSSNPGLAGVWGGAVGTSVGFLLGATIYVAVDVATGGAISVAGTFASFLLPTVFSGIIGADVSHHSAVTEIDGQKNKFTAYQEMEYKVGLPALQTALGMAIEPAVQSEEIRKREEITGVADTDGESEESVLCNE